MKRKRPDIVDLHEKGIMEIDVENRGHEKAWPGNQRQGSLILFFSPIKILIWIYYASAFIIGLEK